MTSSNTTGDDIDLNTLKRALADATPAPDATGKAEVMARSQEIFANAQGSLAAARQSSATPKHRGLFAGAFDMLISRTTGALTATTALVAVGFLFLSPQGQELLRGPQIAPPLVQVPVADPAPVTALEVGRGEDPAETGGEAEVLSQPPISDAAPRIAPGDEIALQSEAPAPQVAPQPVPQIAVPPMVPQATAPQATAPQTTAPQRDSPISRPAPAPIGDEADNRAIPNGDFGAVLPGDAEGALGVGNSVPLGGISQPRTGNVAGLIAPAEGRAQQGFFADADADATASTPQPNREEFANDDDNPLRVVADDPVSTFSIDVDTAAYSLLRSTLNQGQLPNPDAIRIEEMLNYFPYDYPAPDADDISPFRPTVQVFQTPWNPDTQLVHIGLQGELPLIEDRPPLNLVFLVDTSGSMNDAAKLPLLIQSFRLMLDRLNPDDQVAIVTYAGNAGVVLEPTAASDITTITRALTSLRAGGSTNGVGGLQVAYDLAAEMTQDGEVSRVLLATDGDFNVGISDPDALEDYISEQRETGIYLSVLGFGRGNLQDDTMQALAQNGNGTAAYIDTLHEAQRVLVDQLAGALFPIADDLKVQVEFNPEVIAEYRLIGYETRALAREDFANDAVDAGELGAGHSVTAIYEVTPVGSPAILVAPLRYAADDGSETEFGDELGFISLRWKEPGEDESTLIDFPISATATQPGTEAQFAAAIAGFGQLLRGSDFLGDWGYDDAIALANANRGVDEFGYRTEAVQLMRLAQSLSQ